jgi:hypothetical protein
MTMNEWQKGLFRLCGSEGALDFPALHGSKYTFLSISDQL